MMRTVSIILGALLSAPTLLADEGPTTFRSSEQRVAFIELFTSEGCSSCPPADRWLSSLNNEPSLFAEFVPVAFHVDYWDYIGWKDDFAKAEFSARQRRYIEEGAANVVYTPGLFRNGQEWRTRRSPGVDTGKPVTVGSLQLEIDDGVFSGQFETTTTPKEALQLNVAILGLNLETEVRAGENRGKTLYHDFVVVGFSSVELKYADGQFVAVGKLPDAFVEAQDLAVAAWVSTRQQLAPIQAVGGYLPGS